MILIDFRCHENLPLVWNWTYFLHLCLGCQTKQGSQWKVNESSQLSSLSSTQDLHLATAKALSKFSCGTQITSGYGSKTLVPGCYP